MDQISHQSDEILQLNRTDRVYEYNVAPYPGLDANLELYNMLQDGYRMQKPQFSNRDIYDIMLNCWAEDPNSRPSFKDLRCRFNAMMPDEVQDRLLKLNEPYVALNVANAKNNGTSASISLDSLEMLPSFAQGYLLTIKANRTTNVNLKWMLTVMLN
ncbi:hypothetical protein AND_003477 [Anopheles darlingi]|uniref:Serine-threonine/tyrosine-protein kinase catalytic domain-containing protein n=1 Tax=Anopheles darlingi TaxID=43151 RepID=W5JKV1_ANODA|nr:hypothetical protein AND_003477 [Anopheles darlingi]